jgi:phage terminase small subunit
MEEKLTCKQEKYVQGLFTRLSQREAYKQSYSCENMSDNAIDVEASRLSSLPKISLRIQELTAEFKERNMITIEKVLAELVKIGLADVKDFLRYGTEKICAGTDDDGQPVFEYRQIVEAKSSDEVDGTLVNEVSIGKDGTFKFKLHDKMAALEKIGKHLKMFTDKVEHAGSMDIKVSRVAGLTDEEKAQLRLELMSRMQIEPDNDD